MLCPLVALGSAGLALLLGASPGWSGVLLLLAPWGLASAAGLAVLATALSQHAAASDLAAREPAGVDLPPREIDLRDGRGRVVPLPRQDRQPLDDVGKGFRGPP